MVSTFILFFVLLIRYILLIKWMRAVHILTKFDNVCNSWFRWWLLLELCLCSIAPYPFFKGVKINEYVVDYDEHIVYELNHILLVFSFIWTYILVRWALINSRYMNSRAYRVSILNGCTADYSFATKCLMKEKPLFIQIAAMTLSIFFAGFCFWVFERPLGDASN